MSMLSPEESARLSSAESLFPSPIPVQSISSDEFMPVPQTPRQREFEVRIKEMGTRTADDRVAPRLWVRQANKQAPPVVDQCHRPGRKLAAMQVVRGETAPAPLVLQLFEGILGIRRSR